MNLHSLSRLRASLVGRKLHVGKRVAAAADAVRLDALCAEDAVGHPGAVAIVAEREHLFAAQNGHEGLCAGVLGLAVFDVEE